MLAKRALSRSDQPKVSGTPGYGEGWGWVGGGLIGEGARRHLWRPRSQAPACSPNLPSSSPGASGLPGPSLQPPGSQAPACSLQPPRPQPRNSASGASFPEGTGGSKTRNARRRPKGKEAPPQEPPFPRKRAGPKPETRGGAQKARKLRLRSLFSRGSGRVQNQKREEAPKRQRSSASGASFAKGTGHQELTCVKKKKKSALRVPWGALPPRPPAPDGGSRGASPPDPPFTLL